MSEPFVDDATVARVHRSRLQCCISVTGGGSGLISRLLEIPGGSATLVDAVVPYNENALISYLKHEPDQFCSSDTALAMAAVSLRRAKLLANDESGGCIGVGLTASLVSGRPKRGDHRIHAAAQTDRKTELRTLVLAKGLRSRREEEEVAASLGFALLAAECGVHHEVMLREGETIESSEIAAAAEWCDVRNGDASYAIWNQGSAGRPKGLLSGSFNPRHSGHDGLRNAAADHLGEEIGFEIPIVNADKPPLDDISLAARLGQFHEPVLLTRAATFVEKSHVLPGTVFVIGIDTATRILDERFYPDTTVESALSIVRENGCRFLVAARHVDGVVTTLQDLDLVSSVADLFSEIPADRFLERISSTELRRKAFGSMQP